MGVAGSLFAGTHALAEPVDPAFVAELAKYGRAMRGVVQGHACATSVSLPQGLVGYDDTTRADEDQLTVPLGGQRNVVASCGPAPSYAPTSAAYVAYSRGGRDNSIRPGSVVVRPTRLGGLDAVRIELDIITGAPAASAFQSTEVVAYDKAPTGGARFREVRLTTTVDHAAADRRVLEALLAGYSLKSPHPASGSNKPAHAGGPS